MQVRTAGNARREQERSRVTRKRLLEAAIDCLAELGWSGVTMSVVAARAGVSRGASQHHYRTRDDLVTAAVDHVFPARMQEIRRRAARVPKGRHRTDAIVAMLAGLYTSPIFRAALQLWVAAASDEKLRAQVVPLEARLGREVHRFTVELLGADERKEGVRETVQATLDLLRGLALANLLTDDSARRRKILRQWARLLDEALGQ